MKGKCYGNRTFPVESEYFEQNASSFVLVGLQGSVVARRKGKSLTPRHYRNEHTWPALYATFVRE